MRVSFLARLLPIVSIGVVLLAAGCSRDRETAEAFAAELERIEGAFGENAKAATNREEYDAARKTREADVQALLDQYTGQAGPALDLQRVWALLSVGRSEEAAPLLEPLTADGSVVRDEARLARVHLLRATERAEDALAELAGIEDRLPRNRRLFEAWLFAAYVAPHAADKARYAKLFVEAEDLPASLVAQRPGMVGHLAMTLKDQGDMDGARDLVAAWLDKVDEKDRPRLESTRNLLGLIGQLVPAFPAKHWLNGSPLDLTALQGKAVVLDFWATWCPPCRAAIPTLVDAYTRHAAEGLVVIGYTRFYGTYRDDETNAGQVPPEEELRLTRLFLDRFEIAYPIAVAEDSSVFDAFSVKGIPTLFFIDRAGRIVDVEVGFSGREELEHKIARLVGG